jgi:hypothetical protein
LPLGGSGGGLPVVVGCRQAPYAARFYAALIAATTNVYAARVYATTSVCAAQFSATAAIFYAEWSSAATAASFYVAWSSAATAASFYTARASAASFYAARRNVDAGDGAMAAQVTFPTRGIRIFVVLSKLKKKDCVLHLR